MDKFQRLALAKKFLDEAKAVTQQIGKMWEKAPLEVCEKQYPKLNEKWFDLMDKSCREFEIAVFGHEVP